MTATHHVPTVTDDMLRRLIDDAASPVAVLFLDGDGDRMWFETEMFKRVAQEFDDRAIFVRIYVVENPTVSAYWMTDGVAAEIVVFRASLPKARLFGEFTTAKLWKLIEAVLADGRRA